MSWKDRAIKVESSTSSWRDRATSVEPDVSEIESALRGIASGASLGFSDEITGALESAFTDKSYEQARNESRQNYKQAQDANPYAYGAGQIGGAIGTAFVPGLGQMNLAKAAALGATQALGDSEAEDIKGLATDVALGGTIGAATHGVMEKVVGPALKYGANKISKMVPDDVGEFVSKKIGRGFFGVDEKATENYLRNPEAVNKAYSLGEIADSVLNKADDSSALNELRKKSSELSNDAWKTLSERSGLNKFDVLDSIDQYIADPKSGLKIDGVTIGNAQDIALKKLTGLQKQIEQLSGSQISESNLKRIIQSLDENINWNNPEAGPTNDAYRTLRTFIDQRLKTQNEGYKRAMEKVEDVTKASEEVKSVFQNRLNPENYDKFNKAVKNLANKDELSSANRATDKIKEHTGYDLRKDIVDSWTKSQFEKGDINGSRKTLLGTVIGGSAGSLAGGPVGGAIGSSAGSAAGFTADRFSGPIFKKFLDGQINAGQFIATHGSKLGKYAKVLSDASQRGPQALTATHFILASRDANYRQQIKSLEEQD